VVSQKKHEKSRQCTYAYTLSIEMKKVVLCLTNKALRHEGVRGSGCIDPRYLDLVTRLEVSGQFHAPATFSPGKEPPVPTE
jgi:hypothetical protein